MLSCFDPVAQGLGHLVGVHRSLVQAREHGQGQRVGAAEARHLDSGYSDSEYLSTGMWSHAVSAGAPASDDRWALGRRSGPSVGSAAMSDTLQPVSSRPEAGRRRHRPVAADRRRRPDGPSGPPRPPCSTSGASSPPTSWPTWPHVPDASVPSLAALAHEVRLAWCGPEVEVEGILSAKTGGCPEDCHFCSPVGQVRHAGEGHAVPRHRRGARRRRGDGGARGQRVLHRARRARARRAHDAAHPRAGAARAATRPASTSPCQRRHPHATTRPSASPTAACTATTTTSRRPARSSRRSSPPTRGRSGSTPAGSCASTAWSCAAACCSAWASPSTQRLELLGELRARRPGRGAAQLPQPAARHAARRPPAGRAARGHPLDRAVPPRPARR